MKLREFSTSGLVGYWKMNEGTGATAKDQTPNANNGTITGASWVAGKILAKALSFDGVDDDVNIDDHANLDATSMSIEFWFLIVAAQDLNARILDHQISGPADGYSFVCQTAPVNSFNLSIRNGITGTASINSGSLALSAWHHVVGTTDSSVAELFVDGVLVGTDTSAARADAAAVLNVARRVSGANRFAGRVDELKIYNRILSAIEVARHYAAGKYIRPKVNKLLRR